MAREKEDDQKNLEEASGSGNSKNWFKKGGCPELDKLDGWSANNRRKNGMNPTISAKGTIPDEKSTTTTTTTTTTNTTSNVLCLKILKVQPLHKNNFLVGFEKAIMVKKASFFFKKAKNNVFLILPHHVVKSLSINYC